MMGIYTRKEKMRGIRITDHCDQSNLTTKKRLDLFIRFPPRSEPD